VARTPELDRRLAILAEDNERCRSSRAALARVVARLVDVRREPGAIVLADAGRSPRR
jgi:hypothetical protein